jgi:hypothetical protein
MVVGVVALGAGTVGATTPPPDDTLTNDTLPAYDTAIGDAVESCIGVQVDIGLTETDLGVSDFEILDDGHSVIMSGVNIFDPTLSTGFDAYECVRDQLGLPEWTSEVMGRTTSQFGLVTVELEDGYTVRWSYHPDNGPMVVLHDEEAG